MKSKTWHGLPDTGGLYRHTSQSTVYVVISVAYSSVGDDSVTPDTVVYMSFEGLNYLYATKGEEFDANFAHIGTVSKEFVMDRLRSLTIYKDLKDLLPNK